MTTGFPFAINELSLVLFTTLAPTGALAFVLMVVPLFRAKRPLKERARLSKLLCIPLVVTMAGLVASATHLGNPDNALYVLTGVGRSPLSNEVVCAVAFLALAGVYWLLTFSHRFPLVVQRVWLVVASVSAVLFIGAIAFAYHQDTIESWNLWQVPSALCLNALTGGPLLALLGFRAAHVPVGRRVRVAALAVASVALTVSTVVYVLQGIDLATVSNSFGTALSRVPSYWAFVAGFVVLGALGLALAYVQCCRAEGVFDGIDGAGGFSGGGSDGGKGGNSNADGNGGGDSSSGGEDGGVGRSIEPGECGDHCEPGQSDKPNRSIYVRCIVQLGAACLCVLAGIFLMRFAFYASHLTVGL